MNAKIILLLLMPTLCIAQEFFKPCFKNGFIQGSLSVVDYATIVPIVVETIGDMNKIDLSNKSLTDIDNLDKISVEFNGNQVPLSSVPNLILDLSTNLFTSSFYTFDVLENVKILNINNSGLFSLEYIIPKLPNLERLNAASNTIFDIPKNINDLKSLKYLNVANNSISYIDENLANLPNLEELDISYIKRTSYIPNLKNSSLKRLINIKSKIDITNKLPDNIQIVDSVSLKDFASLYGIHAEKLFEHKNISINLTNKNINNLDNIDTIQVIFNGELVSINSLNNLILDLSYNKITKVPDSIVNLSNLNELLLSDNPITYIPEFIGLIPKLEILELKYLDNKNPIRINDLFIRGTNLTISTTGSNIELASKQDLGNKFIKISKLPRKPEPKFEKRKK